MCLLKEILPLYICSKVVKGFGRGSKQLGIPTANLDQEAIECLPENLPTGIYHGFASIDSGAVLKMVVSVGWNPYYNNEKKSMEVHLLHKFEHDFYDSFMKIILLGYIRPEKNFPEIGELIKAIKNDIEIADLELSKQVFLQFRSDQFWNKEFNKGHDPSSKI